MAYNPHNSLNLIHRASRWTVAIIHERLSFYTKRDSIIHGLNPLTKLTLALSIVFVSFLSPWYWTAHVLLLAVIVPLVFAGKVAREYFVSALRVILPAGAFIFFMQAFFQPIGQIVVFKFWFLDITQESLAYAFQISTRIALMVSSFTLFLLTTHPSEMMSDLTRRGLPPQFAYVIISTLQILPQMQAKAQTIIAAQRSRGLDTQGSFRKRVAGLLPLVGPLVFGSLVEVEERAIAIEARGFTSPRPKTFLREIPETRFDKSLRIALVLLVIGAGALRLWPS